MEKPERLKNEEHVTHIKMFPAACVKCRIGQDWYRCQFEVDFVPGDCYPDYMQVDEYVASEIDGKELNIEQASRKLYDFMSDNYTPEKLTVCSHVRGCRTHFDVDVFIEG